MSERFVAKVRIRTALEQKAHGVEPTTMDGMEQRRPPDGSSE